MIASSETKGIFTAAKTTSRKTLLRRTWWLIRRPGHEERCAEVTNAADGGGPRWISRSAAFIATLSRLRPLRPRAQCGSTDSPTGVWPGLAANWSRRLRATPLPEWCQNTFEVRSRKLELIGKTEAAVKDRLTKEINYWDHRAEQLKLQEQAGKPNARLNSGEARKRADALQARLEKRMEELKLEGQISPLPPVVLGGSLVVPAGLIALVTGRPLATRAVPADHQAAAARARAIVMQVERSLGFEPTDREFLNLGLRHREPRPGTGQATAH